MIMKDLRNNHQEILEIFTVNASDRKYQIWERNPLSISLWTQLVFKQKLNYIHLNPMLLVFVRILKITIILLYLFILKQVVINLFLLTIMHKSCAKKLIKHYGGFRRVLIAKALIDISVALQMTGLTTQ